eukprot:m.269875 g.269875  ORF g.269875 m.269875 type:complete len:58 (+) comp22825_c0_seq25:1172-1345(+)
MKIKGGKPARSGFYKEKKFDFVDTEQHADHSLDNLDSEPRYQLSGEQKKCFHFESCG